MLKICSERNTSSDTRDGIPLDPENQTLGSFLDLARWVAAVIVFFGHLRNPLFLGYESLPADNRLAVVQAWYFVTGWHAEAVIVFFVLSGYLVGGGAITKAREGHFVLKNYTIDRITRLYIPLVPALLLTALLDYFGANFFSETGLYTHTHPMLREKVATEAFSTYLTFDTFLRNLAMLQTIAAPSFGSNQPLWTISLEFWFYAVFGLALASWRADQKCIRIFGLIATVLLVAMLGVSFPFFMGLWLIGAVIAFVPTQYTKHRFISLVIFLIVLALVRLKVGVFREYEVLRLGKDYLVAISFALLLASMRGSRLGALESLGPINRYLSNFSYSLYLLHFPLMLFVLGLLHASGEFEGIARGYEATDFRGLLAYMITIAVVLVGAWLMAAATERQTWRVRRFLRRWVGVERRADNCSTDKRAASAGDHRRCR